jgi:hypothetical protein
MARLPQIPHFFLEGYHRFLHLFHTQGLDLDRLTDCWVRLCLVLFQPKLAGLL